MASLTDLKFSFVVKGLAPTTFVVTKFTGHDSLSQPFNFMIDLASRDPNLTPKDIVDCMAELSVWKYGELQQQWHGIIRQFTQCDTGYHHTFYQVEFVPPLARSALRQNSRIFQTQKVPDIISILLKEMEINDYNFSLTQQYQPREYCVQYRETDLDFIERIAAEEGIFYYFMHNAGKNTVVFTDDTQNVIALPKPIPYNVVSGGVSQTSFIHHFSRNTQIRPSSAQLKDHYFEKPAYSFLQAADGKNTQYQKTLYEYFDYPGRYKDDFNGKLFTKTRIESLRRDAETAYAESNEPKVLPSIQFQLQEHNDPSCNREWFIVRVHHEGTQPQALEESGNEGITTYNNNCTVIPSNYAWCPPFNAKPRVDGPQIAMVVGPENEEIYCDTFGRVKVQFPWDRYSNSNDKASCWIRVSQGLAGAQYGMMALPRVGHEVIVSFIEGDPDQPIVTGRTYHAINKPPYDLPTHKTRTVIRTKTHQGEGYNEVHFEDQKDHENIYVQAQKDMSLLVKNDRNDDVKNNWILNVDKERFSHIKGTDHLTVEQESRTHIKADQSLFVDGSLHMKHGKNMLMETANETHIKAGDHIVIDARAELTLKAGGSLIKIDASGVSISGAALKLNSGGSAGKGQSVGGEYPQIKNGIKSSPNLTKAQKINFPQTQHSLKSHVGTGEKCEQSKK